MALHKRQLFEGEKFASPTPELIAMVTNASKVLKVSSRRRSLDRDMFGPNRA